MLAIIAFATSDLKRGNRYKEKYAKDIPVYPSHKNISNSKTNEFYNPFHLHCYGEIIPKLQEWTSRFPYIPDEIWLVILTFQMYLEKNEAEQHHDWLYSEYSKTSMIGMKLRSRQLYLPNIYGIVLNEGLNIINCGERAKGKNNVDKKRIIENLSKYFLNYIVKWFHWLNKVSETDTTVGYRIARFNHLIYTLKLKSKYFMEEVTYSKYTEKTYKNFYYAEYFINTYYINYQWDCLTYKDIDFEKFIFENDYYNKVYKKAMLLRNYKRINLFLHN